MENLSSLKLPYEAHLYTERRLAEASQMHTLIIEEGLESIGTRRRYAPLKVDVNSYDMRVVNDVESYQELLGLVAQIAALNPQYQLFFRGQTNSWIDGNLDRSVCSGLWRNNPTGEDIEKKISHLNWMGSELINAYERYYAKDPSARHYLNRLKRNPLVRWALLQHYGVCETPLLDITRNLQVACTFARVGTEYNCGYVYVLALPYQRESITIDDVQGMTVMSLFGVTPASARRPLNQDGFLTSTSEWWRYTASNNKLDAPTVDDKPDYFRRVATVFRIPTDDTFYRGTGLSDLSSDWLCPKHDEFAEVLIDSGLEPRFWSW